MHIEPKGKSLIIRWTIVEVHGAKAEEKVEFH